LALVVTFQICHNIQHDPFQIHSANVVGVVMIMPSYQIVRMLGAVQKLEIHYRRGKLRLTPNTNLGALGTFSSCNGNTSVNRWTI